jgi:hypothetical protein
MCLSIFSHLLHDVLFFLSLSYPLLGKLQWHGYRILGSAHVTWNFAGFGLHTGSAPPQAM